MIIFDEGKYAQKVLRSKEYHTNKNQGRERSAIVRYLSSLGYDRDNIKKELHRIPMLGDDYLSFNNKDMIYDKIINKANNFTFVNNVEINISQKELDIILNQKNDKERDLLFVYLVYYKWASKITHLNFYSKKDEVIMVVENDKDLWKISGLNNLRVKDRYKICSNIVNSGLYKQHNFKKHNYFYLSFLDNDLNDTVLSISNFDNILGELYMYINPNDYMRCMECGTVIKKTSNNRKYCTECAREINIQKTKENRKI